MAPEKYDRLSRALVMMVLMGITIAFVLVMGWLPGNPGPVPPATPPPLYEPAGHGPAEGGEESVPAEGEGTSEEEDH